MNESVEKAQVAWQPLTMRGVAAFAGASMGRLLLVQFIVALLAAGSVVWCLHRAWFPTIGEAIRQLPPQGELRSGRLDWQGRTPSRLAEGDFWHSSSIWTTAGKRVRRRRCRWSLAGPTARSFLCSATCKARIRPAGLWLSTGPTSDPGGAPGRRLFWQSWPGWWSGFDAELGGFGDGVLSPSVAGRVLREPGPEPAGSWRLAGAALMPGALFLCAAILLYGLGALDLVRLAVQQPCIWR